MSIEQRTNEVVATDEATLREMSRLFIGAYERMQEAWADLSYATRELNKCIGAINEEFDGTVTLPIVVDGRAIGQAIAPQGFTIGVGGLIVTQITDLSEEGGE